MAGICNEAQRLISSAGPAGFGPSDLHLTSRPFCGDRGRPSVDPEMMNPMLDVGGCYALRWHNGPARGDPGRAYRRPGYVVRQVRVSIGSNETACRRTRQVRSTRDGLKRGSRCPKTACSRRRMRSRSCGD